MELSTKTPRIEVVDALRGFAVMAILLVHNLEHFIFPVYPESSPEWLTILDAGVFNATFSLFAGKSYNLKSLTVGTTEEEDTSRITISTMCDDITFEQIKKQLNRMVEVIKVMDLTNVPIHMKEIMFAKVKKLSNTDKAEVFRIAQVFHVETADIGEDSVLLECKLTERRNNELIELLKQRFQSVEIVRGGAVAIESIATSCR